LATTTNITTAHNIVIQYALASVFTRIGAFIIDLIIVLLLTMVFSYTISVWENFYWLVIVILWSFYHLAFEIFNKGTSPGKMALKLRVVNYNGMKPDVESLVIRWIFRLLDIGFSFGMLATYSIVTSERKQRLGGYLSRTLVINTGVVQQVSLKSLTSLPENHTEKISPKISNFNDEDMLFVKSALYRFKAKPTDANHRIIDELFEKICQDLDLDAENYQKNKVGLIDRVLTDYILSTR